MLYESKQINDLVLFHYIRLSISNIKAYSFFLLILFSNTVYAVNTAILDVASFSGKGVKLEGIKISVIDLNQKKPQFKLSASRLALPKPFNDLSLVDISCNDFTWNKEEIHCNQGRASVRSAFWQSPKTGFSFHLGPKINTIQLDKAQFAGSRLSLTAEATGNAWNCKFDIKNISNKLAEKVLLAIQLKSQIALIKQGALNLSGVISGHQKTVEQFNIISEVRGLTGQTEDGKYAAEKLNMQSNWEGKKNKDDWYWQSENKFIGSALYVDPVYLEAAQQPIILNAHGFLNTKTSKVSIQSFNYQHPDVGVLNGIADIFYKQGIKLGMADVNLKSNSLQGLLTTYINPFFKESLFTNTSATGALDARFYFTQEQLTNASLHFSKLNVKDDTNRTAIKEGYGSINWSDEPLESKSSVISWQKLIIKDLPLQAASLKFSSQANRFELAEKIKLPFFNGMLAIDKFSWQGKKQDEPNVSFAGSLTNVSLERLSTALGWTPLLGNISGRIPGVNYHNKTLSMDGELNVKVFDGTVTVNNLTSSGLFTTFPRVSGDVEIENLNLDQLTRRFEFGNITGRLSGFVNKLVLENWHPVTFFAWFGTPDNDDSSHRISQKAVKNIASIGGGGAADLLSRSFLGFFETFGYDKIGVGCYLHNGVCQKTGLGAAGQGYYLIKGGGLPRIDVLGYNTQVNWDVLVERLGRVASPDQVIVK
jgi:hypothetical protein